MTDTGLESNICTWTYICLFESCCANPRKYIPANCPCGLVTQSEQH